MALYQCSVIQCCDCIIYDIRRVAINEKNNVYTRKFLIIGLLAE